MTLQNINATATWQDKNARLQQSRAVASDSSFFILVSSLQYSISRFMFLWDFPSIPWQTCSSLPSPFLVTVGNSVNVCSFGVLRWCISTTGGTLSFLSSKSSTHPERKSQNRPSQTHSLYIPFLDLRSHFGKKYKLFSAILLSTF